MTLFAVAVAAGVVVAVVVHEAGHAVAARAVGATTVRTRVIWPRIRVEADVAPDRWRRVAFLAAGPLANVAVAAIACGAGGAGVVVGLVNGACAVVNLVPHGDSDGARLLALFASRSR